MQGIQERIQEFMSQLDASDLPDTDWCFDEVGSLGPNDFDDEAPTIPYVRRPSQRDVMSSASTDGPDAWRALLTK